MISLKDRLKKALLDKKLITEKELARAIQLQREKGGSLSKILVKEGFLKEDDLTALLSKELDIPFIDLSKYKIEPFLLNLIPPELLRRYLILPISKIGQTLTVAIPDPLNVFALDELRTLTGCEIEPILCSEDEISTMLEKLDKQELKTLDEIVQESIPESEKGVQLVTREEEIINIDEITKESEAPPIVKMVELIIKEALERRASDIHIEPTEKDLRIRYRIDGNLIEFLRVPKKYQNALTARIKIISGMDITNYLHPQDGRFRINFESREIDFRVSILPITGGGKIVMRALDKTNLGKGLDSLGFLPEEVNPLKEASLRPYGMILITGPTGSGKSTTLYSIITQINTIEKNILTIEDPVEYHIEGTTQIQVNPEIGLSFSKALRAVLRQSPDIIMVGEIRDYDTADIAIKASLTGQLLLTTLHTNDAPSAILRLIDMGIEPFLIASSLIIVCAQRLCRRICLHCKEEVSIPPTYFKKMGLDLNKLKSDRFYKGKGCKICNFTGYFGRMGILESLVMDNQIKEMILKRVPEDTIRDYARSKGMRTLRELALEKFVLGLTTLEEVLRVTAQE